MGKYLTSSANVYSIFAQTAWTNENIKTFPANFTPKNSGNEFIKISVIPSGPGVNLKSVSGVLIADIFVEAGKGPKRISYIADKLDTYLSGKSVKSSTRVSVQMNSSSLTLKGLDPDNSSLYRATYTIPFNYYEAS